MSTQTPAGFAASRVAGVDLIAHDSMFDSLAAIIMTGETIYDWAATRPQPQALRGRAPVYVATLPDTTMTIAVRHGWHGGALAALSGDRWFRPTRAPLELRKSLALAAAGIPASKMVGYALYPLAGPLVRVDVMSEYLPHTFDLNAVLSHLAPGVDTDAALDATRQLLTQLAEYRLVHPDLNARNILIRGSRTAAAAFVIDVDVMQHRHAESPQQVMRANTARLVRSIRKWRTRGTIDFDESRLVRFEQMLLEAAPRTARDLPMEFGR